MPLLIDGYNLLNATGIFGSHGSSSLQASRRQLLVFLSEVVTPRELPTTTIVFDARHAPPGLPRTLQFRGMTVQFAPKTQEADDLLEQLIQEHHSPRRLIVVSSDHRIQRAARRRRARAVDSEKWYADALRRRRDPPEPAAEIDKPIPAGDINWSEFYQLDAIENAETAETGPEDVDVSNPFPEGYAEDLLDDREAN